MRCGPVGSAVGISERGQIVGSSGSANSWSHAFVWQDGQMADLDTLPGGDASHAAAINNHDQIVGWATTKGGQRHAVLWTLRRG